MGAKKGSVSIKRSISAAISSGVFTILSFTISSGAIASDIAPGIPIAAADSSTTTSDVTPSSALPGSSGNTELPTGASGQATDNSRITRKNRKVRTQTTTTTTSDSSHSSDNSGTTGTTSPDTSTTTK
jgi:hypothetical protein